MHILRLVVMGAFRALPLLVPCVTILHCLATADGVLTVWPS